MAPMTTNHQPFKPCFGCDGDAQATHRTPDGYPVCAPCLLQMASEALTMDPTDHPEDWGITIDTLRVGQVPTWGTWEITPPC